MKALTLKLKTDLAQRVDCSPLTPDKLAGKDVADIAAIELVSGRLTLPVEELFDISGDDVMIFALKTAQPNWIISVMP
jgi:formylmethanofuran dehydrogenase subunit C